MPASLAYGLVRPTPVAGQVRFAYSLSLAFGLRFLPMYPYKASHSANLHHRKEKEKERFTSSETHILTVMVETVQSARLTNLFLLIALLHKHLQKPI